MIAILDYGSGNLRSAERAFATSGQEVVITSDRRTALAADGLVVPGVGAFAACMQGLRSISGDQIIRDRISKERPIFGICIGMQILFTSGLEQFKTKPHNGVAIWKGEISQLAAPILPHMGWNTVETPVGSTLFAGVEEESFYFVHSFAAKEPVGELQSWSTYGERFLCAVEDSYISATQFHPEKSGSAGLKLIKNWAQSI